MKTGQPPQPLLAAVLLCLLLAGAEAGARVRDLSAVTEALPTLPGENGEAAATARFDMDEESVSLGSGDRLGKWNARLDEYQAAKPSLTLDYGLQLGDRLGTGGSFTHRSDYSEALISGVFAYKPNVRLRLATGQLWASSDFTTTGGAPRVLQNSTLFNARKYWDKDRLLSSLGLSFYHVQTDDRGIDVLTQESAGSVSGLVTQVNGYIVDVGMRPFARSVLRLRRESSSLTYGVGEGPGSVASNQISFARTFDNCVRLEGKYQVSSLADRIDLNLERRRWQISLSRIQEDGGGDIAVQIGYAIPLGGRTAERTRCAMSPARPPAFGALVDAVTARPATFPRAPLTQIDAESTYADLP